MAFTNAETMTRLRQLSANLLLKLLILVKTAQNKCAHPHYHAQQLFKTEQVDNRNVPSCVWCFFQHSRLGLTLLTFMITTHLWP